MSVRDLSDNELLDMLVAIRRECGCPFPSPAAPTAWETLRCPHVDAWLGDGAFAPRLLAARKNVGERDVREWRP